MSLWFSYSQLTSLHLTSLTFLFLHLSSLDLKGTYHENLTFWVSGVPANPQRNKTTLSVFCGLPKKKTKKKTWDLTSHSDLVSLPMSHAGLLENTAPLPQSGYLHPQLENFPGPHKQHSASPLILSSSYCR